MSFPGLPTTNQAAVELPNFSIPWLEANINMSTEATYQFTGVAIIAASASGLVGPAAIGSPAAGAQIVGVLQNNPQIGEAAEVLQQGVSKGLLSNTVSIGQILAVDTAGNFLPATSGQYGVAMAMQAGVATDIITLLISNFGKQ
jgi:hypothetical protein